MDHTLILSRGHTPYIKRHKTHCLEAVFEESPLVEDSLLGLDGMRGTWDQGEGHGMRGTWDQGEGHGMRGTWDQGEGHGMRGTWIRV